MSEFTAGLLYLSRHAAALEAAVQDREGFTGECHPINDRWHVALLEPDVNAMLCMPEGDIGGTGHIHVGVKAFLSELSSTIPLLYFYNAEDYGWGYQVYRQGECAARVDIDYEVDTALAEKELRQMYPHSTLTTPTGFTEDQWRNATGRARASPLLRAIVQRNLLHAHADAFSSFGFSSKVLAQLSSLLDPVNVVLAYRDGSILTLVETFKSRLELEEMSWIM